MDLRPYQGDALQRTRMSFSSGKRAPILVAPTGAGKTVMASAVISGAVSKGKEIWFLAHRFELVEQAAAPDSSRNPHQPRSNVQHRSSQRRPEHSTSRRTVTRQWQMMISTSQTSLFRI